MVVKVLLAGQVDGKFDTLVKRAAAASSKAGPFAALLCTGRFFEAGDASAACPAFITACIDGSEKLPLPVYFIGADGLGSEEALLQLSDAPAACQLHYLGEHGVTDISGLKVAFFDDLRCNNARDFIKQVNSLDGDVDVLLNSDWPTNVTANGEAVEGEPEGSPLVAEIVQAARPRYHVCAHPSIFHQRLPYMNKDLGAGAHATRFISLAAVGNTNKARWIHALGMTPADQMSVSELRAKPEGCTASPYLSAAITKKRKASAMEGGALPGPPPPTDASKSVYVKNLPFSAQHDDVVAFFSRAGTVTGIRWGKGPDGKLRGWAHVQFSEESALPAALELSGQSLMGRELYVDRSSSSAAQPAAPLNLGQAVKDCWFCLSNPQVDVHLVVDVVDEAYLAIDKGPIDDTHALIICIEHYPNLMTLQPGALTDVHTLMSSLQKAYASKKLQVVGFERYLAFHSRGGNHCHLNFIGVSDAVAKDAESLIHKAALDHKFTLTKVDAIADAAEMQAAVKAVAGDGQYFQAFLPDGSRLVHPIARSERHPMAFGREVLAKLAGVPKRSDWRLCKAENAAEEEAKAKAFQEWFMPFSPNGGT